MKPSMHCEEFPCLDISGLNLLHWPAYYTSGVSLNWQVVFVHLFHPAEEVKALLDQPTAAVLSLDVSSSIRRNPRDLVLCTLSNTESLVVSGRWYR